MAERYYYFIWPLDYNVTDPLIISKTKNRMLGGVNITRAAGETLRNLALENARRLTAQNFTESDGYPNPLRARALFAYIGTLDDILKSCQGTDLDQITEQADRIALGRMHTLANKFQIPYPILQHKLDDISSCVDFAQEVSGLLTLDSQADFMGIVRAQTHFGQLVESVSQVHAQSV